MLQFMGSQGVGHEQQEHCFNVASAVTNMSSENTKEDQVA